MEEGGGERGGRGGEVEGGGEEGKHGTKQRGAHTCSIPSI